MKRWKAWLQRYSDREDELCGPLFTQEDRPPKKPYHLEWVRAPWLDQPGPGLVAIESNATRVEVRSMDPDEVAGKMAKIMKLAKTPSDNPDRFDGYCWGCGEPMRWNHASIGGVVHAVCEGTLEAHPWRNIPTELQEAGHHNTELAELLRKATAELGEFRRTKLRAECSLCACGSRRHDSAACVNSRMKGGD